MERRYDSQERRPHTEVQLVSSAVELGTCVDVDMIFYQSCASCDKAARLIQTATLYPLQNTNEIVTDLNRV